MVAANNAILNTVGASISGVTNTLTVTNPSNTASSAARETIVVGGGTAGDPTLNFNVSGVTNWELGIDNSVGDNLTISQGTALGTNDTWRMDTSGRRTMPLQPAFFAHKSANTPNVTGDGSSFTVICDTVVFDQGSNYNNATGLFTAPVAGKYYFSACISINTISASHIGMRALLTTATDQEEIIHINPTAVQNLTTTWFAQTGSAFFSMTAGETITLAFLVSGGTKTIGAWGAASTLTSPICNFKGFLVC